MNLTEKFVSKLTPGKERVQQFDDEVTGFGVRVEPNGRKSFFWYAKVNGTPRFRALGQFPSTTVAEARDAATVLSGKAKAWKQASYAGDDPFEKKARVEPASVPTFRELAEAYIENKVRTEANNPTKAEYVVRWMLKRYFAAWLDRPIDEVTIEDVLTVKNACGARRYAANRGVEFVKAVFNWSASSSEGKINFWRVDNPAKDVECFEENSRERFLQPDELLRFNEALKTEPHAMLRDVLTLALATGARKGDIFSMRWSDIQFEREVWTVPFPKNGKSYNVSLLPAALAVLNRRRAESPESEAYVFPGVGKSGHVVELKKPWAEFRKRAQIPDIRLHDLRRTVGSYLAISGVSLQQIGAALGHRSLQSTQVYAKLHAEAVRDARETGQAKMVDMMKKAKRRAKLNGAAKKKVALLSKSEPKRLSA